MLSEHEPGNMASLSFTEIFSLMIAAELCWYITHAQVIELLLLLVLLHFPDSTHISSCAFKEQDLAARQAVEFAEEERKVGS